jgi:hypothetical protein
MDAPKHSVNRLVGMAALTDIRKAGLYLLKGFVAFIKKGALQLIQA